MRPVKGFFRTEVVLKIKIENFYLQKQLQSNRFSLGTPFFFVEKKVRSESKICYAPLFSYICRVFQAIFEKRGSFFYFKF